MALEAWKSRHHPLPRGRDIVGRLFSRNFIHSRRISELHPSE
jgi:hypothetical protein